jgi:hypothetical protein
MPSEQPAVDISRAAVPVPLFELSKLNQRIGFLEGVWLSIKSEMGKEIVQNVDERYKQICGRDPQS